jgi:pro-kumamolisin-like protein
MPLLPIAISKPAGTTNVTVAQGQQETLTPGPYGALTDNGIILLRPGTYSFSSIALGNNAQLQALQGGSTTIQVASTFATGTQAQIFPPGQQASALAISVAGNDSGTGSSAASFGTGTQIIALLDVPRGTLSLGNNVQATGAFGGFSVVAGTNVTLTFQSGFPPTAQQPAGQQKLPGSFLSAVTTAPLVGPLPGTTTLNLTFALPLQVNGAPGSGFPPIASFIQSLSTHSVQPLTPATFAAAYGPPTGSDTAASGFATANGLTVTRTYGSHSAVSVTGTAAAIESAFYVLLNQYQRSDGSIFYAPANVPSVNLTQPLLGVLGLDNFSRAIRTQIMFPGGPPPPPAPAAGVKGSSTALCPTVSPLGGSDFAGGDFISAYFGSGCTSGLNGQGQTIAVFSLDSYFADDITGYADGTATGSQPLAVPPGLTNISQEVYPSSQSVPFGMQPFVPVDADQGSGVDTEVELDIDMVLSMAPQAKGMPRLLLKS